MPESVTLPPDQPIDSTSDSASAPSAATAGPTDRHPASRPALPLPPPPTDAHSMLELIAGGLAPDADEVTRARARQVWAQLAQSIPTAAAVTPTATATTATQVMPAMPMLPTVPSPSSPIVMAARALREMPSEQLLDVVLQRLRAALPAGATVPASKGIQFQLVPVAPPSPGSR
jgi:hypothetical protein